MPISYPTTNEPYPPVESGLGYGLQTWTIDTSVGVINASRGDGTYYYKGNPEALLEAKIAEPRQIPGHKQCKRKREFCESGVMRYGKAVYFHASREREGSVKVYVSLSPTQRMQDAISKAIAEWPSSGDEYIERAARSVDVYFQVFVRPLLVGNDPPIPLADETHHTGGYHIDAESLQCFDEAIARAAEIVRSSTPSLDLSKRRFLLAKVAARADTDPAFTTAMRSITEGAQLVE